ncbi:MAG: hypothetical protein LBB12_03765 [Holosporaceae bacterium]|jgi:hypothetical protein|nr:hypothetical protein [Holosporaceae bacterium]
MKKTVLALLVAFASFSGANAMNTPNVTSATFHCATNPPVDLVRNTDGKLSLGFMTCQSLNLSCKSYNGITMLAPLIVKGDMSNNDIIAALVKSFGCQVTVR